MTNDQKVLHALYERRRELIADQKTISKKLSAIEDALRAFDDRPKNNGRRLDFSTVINSSKYNKESVWRNDIIIILNKIKEGSVIDIVNEAMKQERNTDRNATMAAIRYQIKEMRRLNLLGEFKRGIYTMDKSKGSNLIDPNG